MRVLWVTGEPPDRGGGGGNIRQSYLLEALARAADTDLLVAGGEPDEQVASVVHAVHEVPYPRRPEPRGELVRRVRHLRTALLPGGPAELWQAEPVRSELARAIRRLGSYDVVVVEHLWLAPLVAHRRTERWVLGLHNAASLTMRQSATVAVGRRQAWLMRREAAGLAKAEREAVARFDLVTTVSESDAAALPGPSLVVPNGVDVARFSPSPVPAHPRLVFTGSLHYLPNVDGAAWFCREVLPLVRARTPEASITLAGRSPVDAVQALAGLPGVRLIADPPEIPPLLAEARCAVVPLRLGSGTRLKALEALAAGRPVVGTGLGLAGLDLADGRHVLMRDDAAAMADAVTQVLVDDALAARLASDGRRLVEQRYDWQRIAERFVAHVFAL